MEKDSVVIFIAYVILNETEKLPTLHKTKPIGFKKGENRIVSGARQFYEGKPLVVVQTASRYSE